MTGPHDRLPALYTCLDSDWPRRVCSLPLHLQIACWHQLRWTNISLNIMMKMINIYVAITLNYLLIEHPVKLRQQYCL